MFLLNKSDSDSHAVAKKNSNIANVIAAITKTSLTVASVPSENVLLNVMKIMNTRHAS